MEKGLEKEQILKQSIDFTLNTIQEYDTTEP